MNKYGLNNFAVLKNKIPAKRPADRRKTLDLHRSALPYAVAGENIHNYRIIVL